jgi:prepilin-type N-terminal cleavage/methylation domain-containing protein
MSTAPSRSLNNPPPCNHGTNKEEEAMKMHRSPSNSQGDGRQDDKGFTLIEILIAIVLIGILSAVAVVGISNLVSKGSTSACGASKDAANAASAVYFGSNQTYPTTLAVLAPTSNAGPLTLPLGVVVNTAAITGPPAVAIGMQASPTGGGWFLTMTTAGTATTPPIFACT